MTSRNVAVTEAIYAAVPAGDLETAVGLLDPQIRITYYGTPAIPYAGDYHGIERAVEFFSIVGTHIEIVEMQRNGTKGMCCGAGGARMWMEESIGTKVNDERAVEALSTGATRVATACPFCYIMLDDGVKAAGADDDQVKVADIAIHLLDALEAGDRKLANPAAPVAELVRDSQSS